MVAALQVELLRREKEEFLRYWNQDPDKRHIKQIAAMRTDRRLKGIFGGNRSGKTAFGGAEVTLKLLGPLAEPYVQDWLEEDKEWWYKQFEKADPIMAWCGTVNWDVHRDVTQPEILRWIPKPLLAKSTLINRKKDVLDYIALPNGSKLTFKSYDSGREAFQGSSLDHLWLDEEPEQAIWREAKQRVMDRKGTITLTMTPLKGLTWAYSEIYLNEAQDPEVYSDHFTWDDNPWLDEGEMARLLATMSDDEIAARKFGEFLAAGGNVLSRKNLMERRRQLKENPEVLYRMKWLETGQFVKDVEGELEIYEEPRRGSFYILGSDVAEGLPSGDNSVGCVLDSVDGRQVAELVTRVDSDPFARQLEALGKMYNTAMIAPERNNNGHAVLMGLDSVLLYPMIFMHEDDRYGWAQNAQTRPIVIAYLQEMVKNHPDSIRSLGLVEEGMTFVRNNRGRPEAAGKGKAGGHKDDRLFAYGIALAVRDQYGPPLPAVTPKTPKKERVVQEKESWVTRDNDKDVGGENYARFDSSSFVRFE